MDKILPANYVEPEKTGGELAVDEKKESEMIAKAIELLGDEPKEPKELADALEQYYVFEVGEHYTSAQLASIVEKANLQLNPTPVVEEVIEEVLPEEPK